MLLDLFFNSNPKKDPLDVYFDKALAEIAISYYIISADEQINATEKQFINAKVNDYLNNTYVPQDFRDEVSLMVKEHTVYWEKVMEILDRLDTEDAVELLKTARTAANADSIISPEEEKRLHQLDRYASARENMTPYIDEEQVGMIQSRFVVEKAYTCECCGANMKFKTNLAKIVCPYCGTERRLTVKK